MIAAAPEDVTVWKIGTTPRVGKYTSNLHRSLVATTRGVAHKMLVGKAWGMRYNHGGGYQVDRPNYKAIPMHHGLISMDILESSRVSSVSPLPARQDAVYRSGLPGDATGLRPWLAGHHVEQRIAL